MKRLLSGVVAVLSASFIFAQVMPNSGIENTVFTGFGSPLNGDPVFYGVIDALQARVDIGKFTLEGMINWGALANCDADGDLDNLTIANTDRNALSYHYGASSVDFYGKNTLSDAEKVAALSATGITPNNAFRTGQVRTDDYYVNFLWHPVENLDVGAGTKLNWQVGPAPRFGSWLWESDAHIRQGGFSTKYDDRHGTVGEYQFEPDAPGSADVVGFVPYANKYAKKALGARYFYNGDFTWQAGVALPNGDNTDDFCVNAGAQFDFENFNIAVAYEGLFQQDGNFYAGAGFGVKQFYFDVYFAWDHIDTRDADHDNEKLMSNSIGAAMTFSFEKAGITIRPESSFNWFENTNFTPSWYVGGLFAWDFAEDWQLSAWSSFAIGSKDKRWDDNDETNGWGTGNIFDIRPEIKYSFDKNNSFAAFVDIENRNAFDGKSRNCWSTGAYWTYKIDTSSKKSGR